MSIKDITVVITSFKSEIKIRNCLNSIDKQCEVINVENSDNQDYKRKIVVCQIIETVYGPSLLLSL